jgi:serine/threonine protein kinase
MTEATIFIAALEKPTEAERAAFLAEACAGDERLRRRVEALLRAHAEPDDLLDPTTDRPEATGAASPAVQDSEQAGAVVAGRYKLLEPIGEGGMGTVWMAEQRQPVKRLVALKLIKPGMDSKAVLARFEAERQALALMDHPNIAKILDGGTTHDEPGGVGAGRPYFVMELVKGRPLTEYCDARRLSIKDRLGLFVQICSAVQHAHQKGIIHRDLKPGNILVTEHDGKPVPKVIDFGLAKALNAVGALTDRTLYTAFGTVVGTPLYVAPEQVGINALDVDTRSDIYAMGVILYELLTGTTPLEKQRLKQAAWDEVRRVIREEEPPRPSARLSSSDTLPSLAAVRQTEPVKLARLVRGDLDWIVMKCLEKDRARRYETANGLARDVQRFLAQEPVEASPPSATYRLGKFLRRNRSRVLAASVMALTLLAGVAAVAVVQVRADRERAAEAMRRASRTAWADASIAAAVREARQRAEEAWGLADYPERMQVATDAAAAAIRRAADYAGGEPPSPAALAELAGARAAVDELARHTRLIRDCVASQDTFANSLDGNNPVMRRAALCKDHGAAFARFGIDPLNGSAAEIGRTIATSGLRDTVLGLLLEWYAHAAHLSNVQKSRPGFDPGCPEAGPQARDRIWQVVRSARAHSGGTYARWQDLLDRQDVPGLVAFAGSPEALTFRSQLINALGRDLQIARRYDACRALLRAAVVRYPHDIWLHHDLAISAFMASPPDHLDAVRCSAAAAALRPDSFYFQLQMGESFQALASYDHALECFRRALALKPESAYAHSQAGMALYRQKKYAEGLEFALEGLRLAPKAAENPLSFHRYNTACLAMKCADQTGAGAPSPERRAAYRKQALELLTADLAAVRQLLATNKAAVQRILKTWIEDADFATVRSPKDLERLAPDERGAWEKLWSDVRDLLARSAESGKH